MRETEMERRVRQELEVLLADIRAGNRERNEELALAVRQIVARQST